MATVSSLTILPGGTSDAVHTYNDDQYTQLVQFGVMKMLHSKLPVYLNHIFVVT